MPGTMKMYNMKKKKPLKDGKISKDDFAMLRNKKKKA
jgi:hypothetical protein